MLLKPPGEPDIPAKYARITTAKALQNPAVREYLDARLMKIESEKIADQTEIMQYLTSVFAERAPRKRS